MTPREDRYYTLFRRHKFSYTSKRIELIGAKTIKDSALQYKALKPDRKEKCLRCCRRTIRNAKEELRDRFELNKNREAYESEVFLRMVSLYKL